MSQLTAVEFFATIAPLPILVAAAIGLYRRKQASQADQHIILLVVVAAISQVVATVMWWKHVNNMFVSHVFTIVECFLLLHYYSFQFSNNMRFIVKLLSWMFVGFALVDFILSYGYWSMNAVSKGIECGLLIFISLTAWRKTMVEMNETSLLSRSFFWINSAVLVYFSANTLLFIFSESILSGEQIIGLSLWAIHLVFMTIYYGLISIGLWKIPKK